MEIEYEAKFLNIDREAFRKRLAEAGAVAVKPMHMQKRVVFNLPEQGCWMRVRDEGDRITMSIKVNKCDKITDQKELCLTIDDFQKAEEFLLELGYEKRAYQENYREIYSFNGAEICIDEWPFLEPYVEIEANSEAKVRETAGLLGLDYSKACFKDVSYAYAEKYNIDNAVIYYKTPRLAFKDKNPFI